MVNVATFARGGNDKLDRTPAYLGGIGSNGGEAYAAVGREGNVVIADDRDILRHSPAALLEPVDQGDGLHIVMGDDGRGLAQVDRLQPALTQGHLEADSPSLARVFPKELGIES